MADDDMSYTEQYRADRGLENTEDTYSGTGADSVDSDGGSGSSGSNDGEVGGTSSDSGDSDLGTQTGGSSQTSSDTPSSDDSQQRTTTDDNRVDDIDDLRFDSSGSVIDDNNESRGIEDTSLTDAQNTSEIDRIQAANRLEEEVTASSQLDEDDVRVVQTVDGNLVVENTNQAKTPGGGQGDNNLSSEKSGSSGNPSPDVIEAPAGGFDLDSPETDFGTELEKGDGPVADQARQLEQQALNQNPNLSPEDVGVVRDGDRLRATTTEQAERGFVRQATQTARQQAAEQSDRLNKSDFRADYDPETGRVSVEPTEDAVERLNAIDRIESIRDLANTVDRTKASQTTQTEKTFTEDVSPEAQRLLEATGPTDAPPTQQRTQSTQAPGTVQQNRNVDQDIVESITTGGFLDQGQEQRLQDISKTYQQGVDVVSTGTGEIADVVLTGGKAKFGDNQVQTRTGKVTQGATNLLGQAGDIPAWALAGESGAEVVEGIASEGVSLEEASEGDFSQAVDTVQTTTAVAEDVGVSAARAGAQSVFERPFRTVGGVGAGVGLSVASGVAIGKGARFARQRVRTAGSETFDIEGGQIVNRETGEFYNPDADTPEEAFTDTQGGRFPGAQDPDLYSTQPAQAVRQQADEFTPENVERRFSEAGVSDGATLKKTLDVEPDGPGARRVGGFETQPGSYESPGGFVGPELSPNFLGNVNRQSSLSLRPGLPDIGDGSTGVLVRTRVRESDATGMDEFNEELLEREGQTTARTKPASAVNEGEIEAVIPPEAEFADIGNRGPVSNLARRAGIGSDFSVRFGGYEIPGTDRKIGGKKVPIRPVVDPDLIESRSVRGRVRDFVSDESGQVGKRTNVDADVETRQLSEIQRPMRPATDRPAPIGSPSTSSGTSSDGSDTSLPDGSDISSPARERTGSSSSGGISDGRDSVAGASSDVDVPSITEPSSTPPSGQSSPPGSGSPGSPVSSTPSSQPISPGTSSPSSPVYTPPSNRRSRTPSFDVDTEDAIDAASADEEEFVKEFEYGVASPEDVTSGALDVAGDLPEDDVMGDL